MKTLLTERFQVGDVWRYDGCDSTVVFACNGGADFIEEDGEPSAVGYADIPEEERSEWKLVSRACNQS